VPASAPPNGSPPPGMLRVLLARDGRAVVAAAAATLLVELGVYLLAGLVGTATSRAPLAALAAATLWVALAGPVLAASARTSLSAVLRGGTVADASALALIVLWLSSADVTFLAAVKIYCALAAMALAAVAATRLARSGAGRYALAVAAAGTLVLGLASPFWIGGPMRAAGPRAAETLAAVAVYANPFYAITAAVSQEAGFVWHQADVLYRWTRLGDYAAAPPACWYASVVIHLAAALVLGALAAARARRPRPRA
jgi:hypothetical protein